MALLSRCACHLQGCLAPSWLTPAMPLSMALPAPLPLLATKHSLQQTLLGSCQQRMGPQWMLQCSQRRPQPALLPQVIA